MQTASAFDVYRDWLGIDETERPLNHYQLLRLKPFEDDTSKYPQRYRKMTGHVRKVAAPEGSYTAKLFAGGVDRIGKKIGEEATEVVIASKNENKAELIWEMSDLLYHSLVLLAARQVTLDEIGDELARRAAG